MEPVWHNVRARSGALFSVDIVLGGMIENWASYRNPETGVERPEQMAPAWYEVARVTGVSVDPSIWHHDPPASSYPASLGVKAAALQGRQAGELYLAHVREAVMTRAMNVARRDVLVRLAEEIAATQADRFDAQRFASELTGDAAIRALERDIRRTRVKGIGRFPTLVLHGPEESRIVAGYQEADALERLIWSVAGRRP